MQIIMAIFIFLVFWFLFPFFIRKLGEKQLDRQCRKRRAIVLSYDDGPSPVLTPNLLDLLATREVQATFFVIGNNTTAQPEIVTRAIESGHEIGSHSFDHLNAWKVWPVRASRDIAAGIHAVRALGGDARLFRPPFGKQTFATLVDCLLRRQRMGWWTIDTRDARPDLTRCPVETVIGRIEASGGGVVLAHDFDKPTRPVEGLAHDEYVLTLTKRVIEYAETNGYALMRLGDVLRGGRS